MTRRGRTARVVGALAAGAVIVGGVLATSSGSSSPAATAAARTATAPLPAGPAAAFTIPAPAPPPADETRWAAVTRPAVARATPGGRALTRLSTRTPESTANLVVVDGAPRRAAGRLWVRARLAVLPNGTAGWVPRDALGGYETVDTRLVVDRRRLVAELFRGGERIFTTRIGIGRSDTPTPAGRFYVRVKLTRYSSPAYGPLAFGLSARSAVLTDWPAGGYIGIHGTDEPDRLPGRVSHGCIRMANPAILRLGRLMPVGTPVTVV